MERFKVTMTRTYVTELHYHANNRCHAEDLCKSDDYRFAAELEQCNVVIEEYESEHCPKNPTNAACWVLLKGNGDARVEPFKNKKSLGTTSTCFSSI